MNDVAVWIARIAIVGLCMVFGVFGFAYLYVKYMYRDEVINYYEPEYEDM